MRWFERLLRSCVPYREIGWQEIGEKFTRYQLVKTPWWIVYLHQLDAPRLHPECHNHPWRFVAIILWRGYFEQIGTRIYRRRPGDVLYRAAEFSHNVYTEGTSWSLIFTGPRCRDWGFLPCA